MYIPLGLLEILGSFLGLVGIYLHAIGKRQGFYADIPAIAIMAYVYYEKVIMGQAFLQAFFLAFCILGLLNWKLNKGYVVVRRGMGIGAALAAWVGASVIVWFLLPDLEHQDPFKAVLDAMVTGGSLVAQFVMAFALIEHWTLWLVVNLLAIILFLYSGLYFNAILFGAYFGMAYYGRVEWLKLEQEQQQEQQTKKELEIIL